MPHNPLAVGISVLIDQGMSFLIQLREVPSAIPRLREVGLEPERMEEEIDEAIEKATAARTAWTIAKAEAAAMRKERDRVLLRAREWLSQVRGMARGEPELAKLAQGMNANNLAAAVANVAELTRRLRRSQAATSALLQYSLTQGEVLLADLERVHDELVRRDQNVRNSSIKEITTLLRGKMLAFMRAWRFIEKTFPDVPPLNLRISLGVLGGGAGSNSDEEEDEE